VRTLAVLQAQKNRIRRKQTGSEKQIKSTLSIIPQPAKHRQSSDAGARPQHFTFRGETVARAASDVFM